MKHCYDNIASSLSLVEKGEDITKNIHTKKEKGEKTKKPKVFKKTPAERFSFIKCQIPAGSELTFDDNPSIRAYVAEEHNVTYNGKVYNLTGLTKELRNNSQAVQGTGCWRYKGKILADIRARLEHEELYK